MDCFIRARKLYGRTKTKLVQIAMDTNVFERMFPGIDHKWLGLDLIGKYYVVSIDIERGLVNEYIPSYEPELFQFLDAGFNLP